ncbi:MAG: addiction module toxin, HicA family, partial [Clostridia bacterium]|nr:addiction module toxin, HicA family [Clostridia bacterium]
MLKPADPKKVVKVLTTLGFICTRQRGSHMIMQHPDGRTTVIPFHSGEDIHKGLLRSIINDIGFD